MTTAMPSRHPAPIRVLIADDSAVMRAALSRIVESSPAMMVCGTARDGLDVLEKIRQLQPDVVTLDVEMPVLNGFDALKRIMKECPLPVVMVSCLTQHGAELTLEALAVGAFDYLSKANSGNQLEAQRIRHELIEKIEAAAHSSLLIRPHSPPPLLPQSSPRAEVVEDSEVTPEIIALGTSTGGPKALQDILPQLPADLPLPMIVVQHMPAGFTAPFAKRLNSLSKVKVREAEDGEVPEPGVVYIAPAGKHTTVIRNADSVTLCLSNSPFDTQHKPSVDVTMLSVAEVFGRHCVGIILTGMGTDGLEGMTAIRNAGGVTIGQDEASCAVYGMPRCCAESGILQKIVPISYVPWQILRVIRYRARD